MATFDFVELMLAFRTWLPAARGLKPSTVNLYCLLVRSALNNDVVRASNAQTINEYIAVSLHGRTRALFRCAWNCFVEFAPTLQFPAAAIEPLRAGRRMPKPTLVPSLQGPVNFDLLKRVDRVAKQQAQGTREKPIIARPVAQHEFNADPFPLRDKFVRFLSAHNYEQRIVTRYKHGLDKALTILRRLNDTHAVSMYFAALRAGGERTFFQSSISAWRGFVAFIGWLENAELAVPTVGTNKTRASRVELILALYYYRARMRVERNGVAATYADERLKTFQQRNIRSSEVMHDAAVALTNKAEDEILYAELEKLFETRARAEIEPVVTPSQLPDPSTESRDTETISTENIPHDAALPLEDF